MPLRREGVEHVGLDGAVGVDVAEHEVLQVRLALEGDAGLLPHRAVGAVATDQKPRADRLLGTVGLAEHATDGAVPGLRAHQRHAPFDGRTAPLEMLAEQRLGLRLRDEQDERKPRVLGGEPTELDVRGGPAVEVKGEARARVSAGHQRLAEPEGLQDLERPRLHRQRPGLVGGGRRPIDDPKAHPERAELGGEREPGRSRADDQDVDRVVGFAWHAGSRPGRRARLKFVAHLSPRRPGFTGSPPIPDPRSACENPR